MGTLFGGAGAGVGGVGEVGAGVAGGTRGLVVELGGLWWPLWAWCSPPGTYRGLLVALYGRLGGVGPPTTA